jgi:dihydrodipicolinate synthase/N-acetylneuraminate lyase
LPFRNSSVNSDTKQTRTALAKGIVIPACPLALNHRRKLDERRQRALLRYYLAAGAGGVAVGVHTTQFAIRKVGLLRPVLEIAAEEMTRATGRFVVPALAGRRASRPKATIVANTPPAKAGTTNAPCLKIAGVCGLTKQALGEASLARELGYHAGLLSLGALRDASEVELLAHCCAVAEVIPVVGFYLQPSVGGRVLPYSFWRRFAEIENVVAIKIAPFNRYQTLDVVRAIAEAGRDDIALYTGNDDNIVMDLLTPFRFRVGRKLVERRIVGGLVGHWAVWTKRAVEIHARCRRLASSCKTSPAQMLRLNVEVTDMNAAIFDTANGFAGCIAGIHEVLRRQGLLEGIWCLDPHEGLSPGQRAEIDRVCRAYPHLTDDAFVAAHRERWLRG